MLKTNIPTQLQAFKLEFDILTEINNKDIVTFFGACLDPLPVMVLGYCERGSLYGIMKQDDIDLTWETGVTLLTQTVRGLNFLHNYNPQIVHRDLKVI